MRNKKNGFFTFIFSLLPGAGEMYFGLYRQGLLLMSMFFGSIAICALTGMGELAFVLPIIWCFGFFHVHNLKNMSEEEFGKISDEKNFIELCESILPNGMDMFKKFAGYFIVLIGVVFLVRIIQDALSGFEALWMISLIFNRALRVVVGVLIIFVGIKLIKGKKKELDNNKDIDDIDE